MNERQAFIYLGLFTALLLVTHLTTAFLFDSIFLKFILFSYALIFGLSLLEIISIRARYTTYSGLVPYVVLGMSVVKMLISILWIFYAISRELIDTGSVMVHFFIPYFLFLGFVAWLLIRMLR
ncbi:MAG: hypothetical protein ACK4KT_03500 [Thermaurantimonas sp.]